MQLLTMQVGIELISSQVASPFVSSLMPALEPAEA